MEGYYKEPELTKDTLEDGFVKTKDMAYLDEEGRCILVGRADDIINYGGSKISPAEIEDCARGYEKIADCAYTSKTDPITGEVPVMLVVKKEAYDEAEFLDYLQAKVEAYKLPRAIYYTDKLPKTFKGSLLRKEIRQYIKESEGKDA